MNTIRLSIHKLLVFFLGCVLCIMAAQAENLAPIPALTAPVMDTANMLQQDTREDLNGQLLDFSRQHGSQIVILTVPTIAPETPFDYATRVMNNWRPGRMGVDDGVLLLLVRDEHKTFIATGRGLEGAIPDVYAKRILDDVLRPQLRANNTDGGVRQTVDILEKLIDGEKLPAVSQQPPQKQSFSAMFIEAMMLVFFGGAFLKNIFGTRLGSFILALLVLALGWYIGWNLILAVIIALFSYIVTYVFAGNVFVSDHYNPHDDNFWGGGGSGGGFSGGGGGYGGGGASGSW